MSKYDKYFDSIGDLWSCKFCDYAVLIKTKSRGSLHFHVTKHHPDELDANFESRKRKSVNRDVVSKTKQIKLEESVSRLTAAVVRKIQNEMSNNSTSSPIVELTRIESFSASHRLNSDELSDSLNEETFGKCNNPNGHGHNYKWEVSLKGAVDTVTGMVYNMANLKKEMAAVLELVDHKNLDLDVDYFRAGKTVSTTENVAVFLYEALKERMECPELLFKVTVHETDKNSFTYHGHRSLSSDNL